MKPAAGASLDRALRHDDMNAARELLEDIGGRGLQHAYLAALIDVVEPDVTLTDLADALMPMWRLLCATPKQHAQAYMQVTRPRPSVSDTAIISP